ncbi:nucleotidyltransferase family protein [Geothrix fuzhouensis]|uniref:nucleotidyltransferase family protein n=1 Tax=Geothrix fuzhouensis TaxID=2966451 RepID=UPI0021497CC8
MILAAGEGRRMGGTKALLRIDGETLLRRTVRAALEAGCDPVVAVIGAWDPGLEGMKVQTVVNSEASEGMASSIRRGITVLLPEVRAALILTVDQPAADTVLLRNLLALAARDPERPAACAYADTLGIPAILPRRLFPDLLALSGDRGAKAILVREATATLPFPGGEADLDVPTDLERFKR